MSPSARPPTLADLLAEAAAQITRLTPSEAHAALQSGALLVDIRSDDSRSRNGTPEARSLREWGHLTCRATRSPP